MNQHSPTSTGSLASTTPTHPNPNPLPLLLSPSEQMPNWGTIWPSSVLPPHPAPEAPKLSPVQQGHLGCSQDQRDTAGDLPAVGFQSLLNWMGTPEITLRTKASTVNYFGLHIPSESNSSQKQPCSVYTAKQLPWSIKCFLKKWKITKVPQIEPLILKLNRVVSWDGRDGE